MLTITREGFDAIETSEFEFEVGSVDHKLDHGRHPTGVDRDTGKIRYASYYHSIAMGAVTAKHGGLEINFIWTAVGKYETYESAFEFEVGINDDFKTNFTMVDEDGVVSGWLLESALRQTLAGGEWESRLELPEAE